MRDGRIRVLIVGDQEIVIRGVLAMLEDHAGGWELVEGGPATGRAVDVVIFDVLDLAEGPSETLSRLVAHSKGVIALGRDLRPDLAVRAMAQGALATVSLGASGDELWSVVQAVHVGETSGLAPLEDWLGQGAGLTQRESDVLALITRGLTNVEIASRLFLSINSVKTYIRAAYAKIGATRRSQAVAWALEHGFPADEEACRASELLEPERRPSSLSPGLPVGGARG
ncbi:MAG: response regulator transcription factor [Nocardioides sp.]